jgi:SOS response regulatory protein OraA/RecX
MLLKTTVPEWIDWVEAQLDPYHDDQSVIRSYFEEVIRLGKPIRPLLSKLKLKGFTAVDIGELRAEFTEKIDEFAGVESRIIARIGTLESRGQGARAIAQDLHMSYPNFRDQIAMLMATINDEQTLAEFYTEKLSAVVGNQKAIKKLVDTLLRKGFTYEDIKRFMKG